MQKNGIQNSEICRLIASIGHTQYLMIADVGLPIPKGVACVDLALRVGYPSFAEVLDSIMNELVYEHYYLAEELREVDPEAAKELVEKLGDVSGEFVPHEVLKEMSRDALAIIRTGENKSYRNIILRAGVNF